MTPVNPTQNKGASASASTSSQTKEFALLLEEAPTRAPPVAPTRTPPGDLVDPAQFGGRGLVFPASNFDPEAAPLVALIDAAFQYMHTNREPMSFGGMSVQEYGLIRARLERTPDTLEEMAQYRDDMQKLVNAIRIEGGEGMPVPEEIQKLLDSWKKSERSLTMSQQPPSGPLGGAPQPNPIVPPANPNAPQTGLPQSGNPFGFNTGGASGSSGASGASRTQGGATSSTERELRDLLKKLGIDDPSRSVYESITDVFNDVIENNAYSTRQQADVVAEIAKILTITNTGYSHSSLPEVLRITESTESRRAHAISISLSKMQPGDVRTINRSGEGIVAVRKNEDGSHTIQALARGVAARLPTGERIPVEPFAAHSYPAGTVITIPDFGPIEIGRTPRQPVVHYPANDGSAGSASSGRRSFDATQYGAPSTLPPAPEVSSAAEKTDAPSSDTTPPPPRTEPDFELPPPITESVVPDIAGMNRRFDRSMEEVRAVLNSGLSTEQKAEEAAERINKLPANERAFAGHAASRWAEAILGEDFEAFREAFDKFDFRQPDYTGNEGGGAKGLDKEKSSKRVSNGASLDGAMQNDTLRKLKAMIAAELARRGLA